MTNEDSTTLPNRQLRKALVLIEEGRQAKELLGKTEKQITLLEETVKLKDSIIDMTSRQLVFSNIISENYRQQSKVASEVNAEITKSIAALNKKIARNKVWHKITFGLGVAAAIIGTYHVMK